MNSNQGYLLISELLYLTDIDNYRLISNLYAVLKVFEKLIQQRIKNLSNLPKNVSLVPINAFFRGEALTAQDRGPVTVMPPGGWNDV